jgi:hypothetical protein
MSEIKRYEPDWDAGSSMMVEEDGMYVKHSDYENLEKRLHDLEDAVCSISDCDPGYLEEYEIFKIVRGDEGGRDKLLFQAIKNSEARR